MTTSGPDLDVTILGFLGAVGRPATAGEIRAHLEAIGDRSNQVEVLDSLAVLSERGLVEWPGQLTAETPVTLTP